MKRLSGLWPSITSFQNLVLAARRAQRGKRFTDGTAAFNFNLERELILLQEELLNKTYRPGPYREFTIREPKVRLISAAPYRDRVVHHALCNVIDPIFDQTFISDSYACRRGPKAAVGHSGGLTFGSFTEPRGSRGAAWAKRSAYPAFAPSTAMATRRWGFWAPTLNPSLLPSSCPTF